MMDLSPQLWDEPICWHTVPSEAEPFAYNSIIPLSDHGDTTTFGHLRSLGVSMVIRRKAEDFDRLVRLNEDQYRLYRELFQGKLEELQQARRLGTLVAEFDSNSREKSIVDRSIEYAKAGTRALYDRQMAEEARAAVRGVLLPMPERPASATMIATVPDNQEDASHPMPYASGY